MAFSRTTDKQIPPPSPHFNSPSKPRERLPPPTPPLHIRTSRYSSSLLAEQSIPIPPSDAIRSLPRWSWKMGMGKYSRKYRLGTYPNRYIYMG